MKKVVSFSGGRTSAYLCKVMIEKFGRENVDFVFMDTGAEHEKTYEFIKNVNNHFNLNLTCLRGDFSRPIGGGVYYKVIDINDCNADLKPWKDMLKKYGVPYIGGMFCTDRMKLKPFKKYCDAKYGKGCYETWLGIRADEPKRLTPKSGIRYMAEITEFEKQDVLHFWSKMPFDLGVDEWLGNCVFCPKKSNLKLAAAQRDETGMYHEFLEVLSCESVRMDNKTGAKEVMYRGKKSLQQLITTFDGSTGDEIKSRIRGAKMEGANSCSESCEVFNDETQTQFDF